eukprot:SM000003S10971  [mRNA]  locus=s3:73369:76884:- [translate_table: standard]
MATARRRPALPPPPMLLLLLLAAGAAAAPGWRLPSVSEHRYSPRDRIPLLAGKVGPFRNPTETYRYYDLPFCKPALPSAHKAEGFFEVLEGYRMVQSPYDVSFKVGQEDVLLCNSTLSTADVETFRKAIKEDYYVEMYFDDLPTWAFIGNSRNWGGEEAYLLVTQMEFDVLGGMVGKNSESDLWAPCHTINYPRETSTLPWYRQAVPKMAMAGLAPFSGVYVELYYLFATVWGFKFYTIYSILFVVFIMLLIVTALIAVAVTYFQLTIENHEWWWRRSVLCGGSTGIYIYGYCFYYYYALSNMQGLMQISFFFGYMACLCYSLCLMLASVSYCASFLFVRHVYQYGTKSSCEELTRETVSKCTYMMEEHLLHTTEGSESSSVQVC